MDTYDLQAIADALGLKSKHAARKRVAAIKDSLEKRGFIVYDPTHGNALTVTLDGLNLLQRMNDLPGTIAEQSAAIMTELGDETAPPNEAELREFKQETIEKWARHRDDHKELVKRIEDLEQQVSELQGRKWWQRLFPSNHLPSPE